MPKRGEKLNYKVSYSYESGIEGTKSHARLLGALLFVQEVQQYGASCTLQTPSGDHPLERLDEQIEFLLQRR